MKTETPKRVRVFWGLVETAAQQVNKLDHFRTTADPTSTPFWCIKLAEIFPVLKQIPIPLFALKERLRVVFHWSDDLAGNRAVACRTNDGSANEIPFITGNKIVEASCKLSCDLIYYEDEIGIPSPMVRIQEELEKGVSLVFDRLHQCYFNTSCTNGCSKPNN